MTPIDQASAVNDQAVALISEGHPDLAGVLNSLGTALLSRFERIGSVNDLDRAIVTKEKVLASATDIMQLPSTT